MAKSMEVRGLNKAPMTPKVKEMGAKAILTLNQSRKLRVKTVAVRDPWTCLKPS